MIINGDSLLRKVPIVGMETTKIKHGGVTHGLGEAGYDIRIKERICFAKLAGKRIITRLGSVSSDQENMRGRFVIASSIEEFEMPEDLVGIVHDKSSWARKGLSVFNTVIEPGWKGFLTLELVYHGNENLVIPAGSGIAQVVFHRTSDNAAYSGRYQHQPSRPVEAIKAE